MNDPHVVKLYYSVKHPEHVHYDKACPLEHHRPAFTVRLENGRAEITMTSHYPTLEDARAVVKPVLRLWELTAALQFRPGELEFTYDRADIIDRNPGSADAVVFGALGSLTANAEVHNWRTKYPDPPPAGIACDEAVELMFAIYCRYRTGRTQLGVAADHCLGMLKMASGGLRGAERRYEVSRNVVTKLSMLASHKGGVDEGRKPDVAKSPYTAAERNWIEEAMKCLILRAAEVAGDPSASRKQITMKDLPTLP